MTSSKLKWIALATWAGMVALGIIACSAGGDRDVPPPSADAARSSGAPSDPGY